MQNGIHVRGIVRRKEAADLVEKLGAEPVTVKDLDKEGLFEAFKGCYGILHFIGIVSEKYGSLEEINVRGTKISLESAYRNQVSRFVVPTGLGVDQYGKKKWATNGYFASKKKIEELCRLGDVPYVIFRPSYILGPGDELIGDLMNEILSGKVSVAGEGNMPFQPIYVQDAATIFFNAAVGMGTVNSIYDLVGPEAITFTQLVSRVSKIMIQEGYVVPDYRIENLDIEEASEILGLSRDEIDVMFCDVLGDSKPLLHDFGVTLSPLDVALKAAVKAVKENGAVY
jgi:nucleoside-diphosphate-sugar epimerase